MGLKKCTNGCGQKLGTEVGTCTSCGALQAGFYRPADNWVAAGDMFFKFLIFSLFLMLVFGCLIVNYY